MKIFKYMECSETFVLLSAERTIIAITMSIQSKVANIIDSVSA